MICILLIWKRKQVIQSQYLRQKSRDGMYCYSKVIKVVAFRVLIRSLCRIKAYTEKSNSVTEQWNPDFWVNFCCPLVGHDHTQTNRYLDNGTSKNPLFM